MRYFYFLMMILLFQAPIGALGPSGQGPGVPRPKPNKQEAGAVINNYYSSPYDSYGPPPYNQQMRPYISPYSPNYAQPPPRGDNYYVPYSTPVAPPYTDRQRYYDSREWMRQGYFNSRYNSHWGPGAEAPNSGKRPSLSDRIKQDSDMRRRDSQLQRDYIREESLRRY